MKSWFLRWLNNNEQSSNEQLMQQFAATGDSGLLETLVSRCGDDLYHYLLSHSEPQLAADICQSTWLKVIEKRKYYKDQGNFKAWLFTLGRNQMLDNMRHANRWQTLDLHGEDAVSLSLDTTVAADEELDRFNKVLARLPFLQKEAFILQQEGFSLAQIAEITEENVETIKSRLRYARNHFNQLLNTTGEKAS